MHFYFTFALFFLICYADWRLANFSFHTESENKTLKTVAVIYNSLVRLYETIILLFILLF